MLKKNPVSEKRDAEKCLNICCSKDLPDNPELNLIKEVTSLFQVTLVEMRAELGIVNRFLV